ncbi:MAG TPA: hydroxysqualene dehydroxylase HpnE [Stellaceae bacterium]|nr:hydroxysqualene dehydroxylase HpnE [Stellaceae bacterium]
MTSPGCVHIVGAGLAGLAAAIRLTAEGRPVALYESSQHAGGRCRSYLDVELGCRIDNGNHLLLAGNTAALSYVEQIGALDTFDRPTEAEIPFIDVTSGERWVLRPNQGALPWWLLSPARRVPGTGPRDYLEALKLRRAPAKATVAAVLDPTSRLFRRLWQPLAVAALNTAAEDASARLFGRILAETLGRGGAACRALLPRQGLSESLIDPALALLRHRGADIRFGARLRNLAFANGHLAELAFEGDAITLGGADSAILAVPAGAAGRLVPGLIVPDDHAPIVNAHFRCVAPANAPAFAGIIGGTAEWVFRKREVVSVTVSAADRLVDLSGEELSAMLWRDVARAYGMPRDPVPPARIVKERRATFRATPAQLERRPASATRWNNLHLAGDYVDTDLPATIEGAIRSGFAAADRVLRHPGSVPAPTNPAALPARQTPETIKDRQRALP